MTTVVPPVSPSYTTAINAPTYNNSWRSTPSSASPDNFRRSPPPRQLQSDAPPPQLPTVPVHVQPQQKEPTPAPLPVPATTVVPQSKVLSPGPEAGQKSRGLGFRIGDLLSLVSGVRHSAESEKSSSKEVSGPQEAAVISESLYTEKEASADIQMDNAPSDSQSLSSNSSISSNFTPSSASSATNANITEGLLPSASITKRAQKSRVISIPEPLPQLNSIGIYESRASSASPLVSSRRKVKKRPTSPGREQMGVTKVMRGRGVQRARRGRSSFAGRRLGQAASKPAKGTLDRESPSTSEPESDERVEQRESQVPQKTPGTTLPQKVAQEVARDMEVPDSEPESTSPEISARGQPPDGRNVIFEAESNMPMAVSKSPNAESSMSPPPSSGPKRARRQSRSLPEEQPTRRSGRTRVKPLEYWRNERIVYCLVHDKAGGDVVPSIRHIVRAEEDGAEHSGIGKRR
ncbi:hypothetical protein V1517DRAFT_11073 [Lipomyces orientalis]|uniref:Uncharacterized protein n=1 Tax=Lipomyces orientalis TaxID=1233043 RepID=A0ACC3TGB3_9ASCO